IGTVVRVVHIGLPDDVREFWQREGRKGRRKEIPFSETVIIPYTRWDHELLERGFNALREWLSLPLEKTVVNRDNKYTMLFTGLFKIIINRTLGLRVSEEELRLLSHLNLAKGGELTARGKRTWQRLNFYEFGPPYGVKRVKITENGYEYLQEASHVDVVEKLQPGCFDYTSDFLVTNLKVSKGRWVTLIEEERPTLHTIYKHESQKQLGRGGEFLERLFKRPFTFRSYLHFTSPYRRLWAILRDTIQGDLDKRGGKS
ncbi:MAG: hypothetical protein QW731_02295, partial [Thermofilaceae archaeon]